MWLVDIMENYDAVTVIEDNFTILVLETNMTVDLDQDKCSFIKDRTLTTRSILVPVICSVIIVANFFVVLSSGIILKRGQEPRTTYLFLGNVALADLFYGVFRIIYEFKNINHYSCIILSGLLLSGYITSGYSVGLIGVDRFCYIIHGIRYQKYIYPERARLFIGVVWIFGFIIGLLPLTGWTKDTKNGKCCFLLDYLYPEYILLLTISAVIPVIIVLILYTIILCQAIKKVKEINGSEAYISTEFPNRYLRMFRGSSPLDTPENSESDHQTPNSTNKSRKGSASERTHQKCKAFKVVFFTSGAFFITWIPNIVYNIFYVYNCEENASAICDILIQDIKGVLLVLIYMNCLINPLIYAWWHKGFRSFIRNQIRIFKIRNEIGSTLTIKTISGALSLSGRK